MKKYNIIFDATLVASGYRSGIYFVAYQFMLALLKEKKFRIFFYFDPNRVKEEHKYALATKIQALNLPVAPHFQIPAIEETCWGYCFLTLSEKIKSFQENPVKRILSLPLRGFRKILHFMFENGYLSQYKDFEMDAWASPVFAPEPALNDIPRKKNFILLYDTIPLDFPELHSLEWKNPNWWYSKMINNLTPQDSFFSISDKTKESFLSHCKHLRAEQFTTTYLAADTQKFYICKAPAQQEEIRKKYGLAKDARYMFSLATLEERKNLLFAVEAYIEFIEAHHLTDFYFLLGGGLYSVVDPRQQKVRETLLEYSNKYPTIRLLGYVPDEDLAPLYSGADFFVYPSVFEGFGLPVLEAMQCGTPVITSNISSLPEVVGDAGIQLDPTDKTAWKEQFWQLYQDMELRRQYVEKGLQQAKKFQWEKFGKIISTKIIKDIQKAGHAKPLKRSKKRPVMVFNGTILSEAFHSGLYNAAKNILLEFMKKNDFEIKLLFFPGPTQQQIDNLYQQLPIKKLPYFYQGKDFCIYPALKRYKHYEYRLNTKIDNGTRSHHRWKRFAALLLRPLRKMVHYQVSRISIMEQNARNKFHNDCDVFFDPIFAARGRFLDNPNILRYTVIYDATPHMLPHLFKDEKRNSGWYASTIASFQNQKAHYFAISESTKKDFLHIAPGARPEQITTSLLAADRKIFHPVKNTGKMQALRKKYGIPADTRFVFSLCSLEVHKNLLFVVETFLQFLEENKIADLVLVLGGGTAVGNQEVRTSLLEQQKKTDRIIITGYLEDGELPLFYTNADFFVFNSLYEGFGLPLLEAMQCSCPIISSNSSSLPEVAGNAALLVNPESSDELKAAMESFYFNTSLRNEYKARSFEQSKNFSWKQTVAVMNQKIQTDLAKRSVFRKEVLPQPVPPCLFSKFISIFFEMSLPHGIVLLHDRLKKRRIAQKSSGFIDIVSGLNAINKERLDDYMRKNPPLRVRLLPRKKRLIISMTSFPQRCYDIHYAIYSLFRQSIRPDKVILWLGEDKFPNKEADLPKTLLDFKKYGLDICWRKDFRAYTKLVHALQEYPEDIIVTADDDIYYPSDWLEKLYLEYTTNSQESCVVAHRTHIIQFDQTKQLLPYKNWLRETGTDSPSFSNFLTGVGGVLYPPHILHPDAFNMDLAMKHSPSNDDIWFYFMALRLHHRICFVKNGYPKSIFVNIQRELRQNNEMTLASQNVITNNNDILTQKILNLYPNLLNLIAGD